MFAKAETARITISGPKLAHSIQITDQPVLRASHAWSEDFLDTSRPPLTETPQVSDPYEVTLYSRISDNDIRKTCVFFYAPHLKLIYLPGHKGDLWFLNAGAIIREGRDGMWSYVSPTWEALVKPYLEHAETPSPSQNLRPSLETMIDHWQKPQPGWLYVLDPRSEAASPGSRIWLVDPKSATSRGSIRTGFDPNFALSRNGKKLCVLSGERESGDLAIIDTQTAEIRHIPFPSRTLYRPWYAGLPPFDSMVVSPNGNELWISVKRVASLDQLETHLFAFDLQSEKFRDTTLDVGHCYYGDFVSSPSSSALHYYCASIAGPLVSFTQLFPRPEISPLPAQLVMPKGCGLAEALPTNAGQKLAILRTDGTLSEIDLRAKIADAPNTCADGQKIARSDWPVSSNSRKLYVGFNGISPDNMSAASEIRVFDLENRTASAPIRTSIPFWSLALSQDNKSIYAVAPAQRTILVLAADTLQQTRTLQIGTTPSLVIVAP